MRMPGRSAKNNSGEIARTRLKLLLVSDQSGVNPWNHRNDAAMIWCVSCQGMPRSMPGAMELRLIRPDEGGQQAFLITAAFPVRQITLTRNEECS